MRRPNYILSFLFAATLLSPALAIAQDDEARDVIIVTATRIPTELKEVGRSVAVVTAEDIEVGQYHFVYDAISGTPGVQITRSGSFGATASLSVRGLAGDQTLVVQDGIVLNNPSLFGNSFDFANLDASDIEQIEILRGAQSTLYGPDAIGGVVNIVTKSGAEGFGANGYVEGGSFGTVRGAATVRGGVDDFSGRLTFSGMRTNGYSSAERRNGNPERDGYDNISISSKVRYAPHDAVELQAVAKYQDSNNEFDSFTSMPIDGAEDGDTEQITIAASARFDLFDGVLNNQFLLTYLQSDMEFATGDIITFDTRGERISYEYQGILQLLDEAELAFGAEYEEQESATIVGFGANKVIDSTSGFGLLQVRPVEGLTLSAGVRHDANSDYANQTTFSLSGALELFDGDTILRSSFSEGFKAPSVGELGFNSDLSPEISEGWDVGLEHVMFDDRIKVQVTYFEQNVQDLIAFDLSLFNFLNVQEFDTSGVEVSAFFQICDKLQLNTNYTYLDAFNVSTTLASGNQPANSFGAEVLYQPTPRLTLSASVLHNGQEPSGAVVLDRYTTVAARVQYQINDTVEVFGRVENATDKFYQDNNGYGTAPVSGYGGVRVRF